MIRNALATLLLAQGTPMLLAGDEFGRTGGNNNAYCQDDEISWLDWQMQEKGESLIAFTRGLTSTCVTSIPFCAATSFSQANMTRSWGSRTDAINANGSEMQQEHWGDTGCAALACYWMGVTGYWNKATGTGSHSLDRNQRPSRSGGIYFA